MISESSIYTNAANNSKTNVQRGDTIRTAQYVPLDNADSYQQQQQTELGHAIFSTQFIMQARNQRTSLYLQSLGSLSL